MTTVVYTRRKRKEIWYTLLGRRVFLVSISLACWGWCCVVLCCELRNRAYDNFFRQFRAICRGVPPPIKCRDRISSEWWCTTCCSYYSSILLLFKQGMYPEMVFVVVGRRWAIVVNGLLWFWLTLSYRHSAWWRVSMMYWKLWLYCSY